jgi:hypothetical protein
VPTAVEKLAPCRRRRYCAAICRLCPANVSIPTLQVLLDFDFTKSSRRLSEACQAPARTRPVSGSGCPAVVFSNMRLLGAT